MDTSQTKCLFKACLKCGRCYDKDTIDCPDCGCELSNVVDMEAKDDAA